MDIMVTKNEETFDKTLIDTVRSVLKKQHTVKKK